MLSCSVIMRELIGVVAGYPSVERMKAGAKALDESVQAGQQSVNHLHQSAETNLALAAHAETWGWKEV